jgi:tyrosinase
MRNKKHVSKDIPFEHNELSYAKLYGIKPESILAKRELEKPLKERKNIKELYPTETTTLKTAIEKAISLGEYQKFVTFHSQYMMDIHSFLVNINQRFLPWHRVYLVKFEEMLNTVMKRETGKEHNIAIPYWDWEHDHELPEFLNDLTPKMDVEVYFWNDDNTQDGTAVVNLTVKRFLGTNPAVPSLQVITEQRVNGIRNEKRYKNFAIRLERGIPPIDPRDGGPHGAVHIWVGGKNPNPLPNPQVPPGIDPLDLDSGGAMGNPLISPLDFCFWCHHANLDRIWAGWQKKQEEQGSTSDIYPDLDEMGTHETSSRMDPWTDIREPHTRKIEMMGYTYK